MPLFLFGFVFGVLAVLFGVWTAAWLFAVMVMGVLAFVGAYTLLLLAAVAEAVLFEPKDPAGV